MHIIIVNASPYCGNDSNTKMIADTFRKSISETENEVTVYSLSDRNQWKSALKSVIDNKNIVFVMPVYVGIVPSIFKEFVEQLDELLTEDSRKQLNLSFILQSAFPESSQRVCGEKFLKGLTESLNCNFSGVLSHSVFWGLIDQGNFNSLTEAYTYFGKRYVENNFNFFFPEAVGFNGPEQLTEQQARKFVRGFNFMCRLNAEENGGVKELCINPLNSQQNV